MDTDIYGLFPYLEKNNIIIFRFKRSAIRRNRYFLILKIIFGMQMPFYYIEMFRCFDIKFLKKL